MVLQALGRKLDTIVLDKHCEAFVLSYIYGHQKSSYSVFANHGRRRWHIAAFAHAFSNYHFVVLKITYGDVKFPFLC